MQEEEEGEGRREGKGRKGRRIGGRRGEREGMTGTRGIASRCAYNRIPSTLIKVICSTVETSF